MLMSTIGTLLLIHPFSLSPPSVSSTCTEIRSHRNTSRALESFKNTMKELLFPHRVYMVSACREPQNSPSRP